MQFSQNWQIRSTSGDDRNLLAGLLAGANRKHQHLDWLSPSELIGDPPFLLALERGLPIGCLACPPNPARVAWIRIFAAASGYAEDEIWEQCWIPALKILQEQGQTDTIAGLVIEPWFTRILERTGFIQTNGVVFYEWHLQDIEAPPQLPGKLRDMTREDLPLVHALDSIAFDPLWRNSPSILHRAFQQATIATVYEDQGQLIGYQISTSSVLGAHLARLGVAPEWQGKHVGTLLVADLLHRFARQGFERVTVNTQINNLSSQRLYAKLGFKQMNNQFPVYELRVHEQHGNALNG